MKQQAPVNVEHYLFSVSWSDIDQVYLAQVAEFPSLMAHGDSQAEALEELKELLSIVLQDLEANQEPVPEPFGQRHYSGKLNLRMPTTLHRKLVIEASQQGVSLNQLITLKLAASIHGLL